MIRQFKEEDLSRIMEIGDAAWQEIFKMFRNCYGDELFEVIFEDEKTCKGKQIKEHALANPEQVFICEEDGKIVGFIAFNFYMDKKIGELSNNAVDPNCKLKGIGQQMYKAVLQHFREKGMLYARVATGCDYAHERARNAYERAGFDISHDNRQYYMKLD
jgi:N-acetylglutamate synthase-like GNAT family acetyltransferase